MVKRIAGPFIFVAAKSRLVMQELLLLACKMFKARSPARMLKVAERSETATRPPKQKSFSLHEFELIDCLRSQRAHIRQAVKSDRNEVQEHEQNAVQDYGEDPTRMRGEKPGAA